MSLIQDWTSLTVGYQAPPDLGNPDWVESVAESVDAPDFATNPQGHIERIGRDLVRYVFGDGHKAWVDGGTVTDQSIFASCRTYHDHVRAVIDNLLDEAVRPEVHGELSGPLCCGPVLYSRPSLSSGDIASLNEVLQGNAPTIGVERHLRDTIAFHSYEDDHRTARPPGGIHCRMLGDKWYNSATYLLYEGDSPWPLFENGKLSIPATVRLGWVCTDVEG